MLMDVTQVGIGEEVILLVVCFYVDDVLIASRDPYFLQRAFDLLMELYDSVGLQTNTTKTDPLMSIGGHPPSTDG